MMVEANVVRLIYDMYTCQGYGVQKIANYLSEQGYLSRSGGRWSHNSIRNILHNPTYTGVLRSGESRSPLLPELQIITEEQFSRAQEIFRQRKEQKSDQPRVPINMKGSALLNGNIFCGHCGARLNLTTRKRMRHHADGTIVTSRRISYVCYGKSRKLTKCDGQTTYVQVISTQYAREIKRQKEHLAKVGIDCAKTQEKLPLLKAEVVKALQGDSAFSPKMLADLIDETEAKAIEQKEIYDTAERAVQDTETLQKRLCEQYKEMISWAELYENADLPTKKMIVNSLIRRVDVFQGYRLEIEFNFNLRQFFCGLDIELPCRVSA